MYAPSQILLGLITIYWSMHVRDVTLIGRGFAGCIYPMRSKIFITRGQPVVYPKWSAANTSDIQQIDPLPR